MSPRFAGNVSTLKPVLSRAQVLSYVQESERDLLKELWLARDSLDWSGDRKWTAGQIAEHLVRTEQIMQLVWIIVPKLREWPRLVRALDRSNSALWRLMGMRTIQTGSLTAATPEAGTYSAPIFLRPARGKKSSYESLIAYRQGVREQSLRAISRLDDETLENLRWSHPLLGKRTLLEFAHFLGIHERHHLSQMKSLRQQWASSVTSKISSKRNV